MKLRPTHGSLATICFHSSQFQFLWRLEMSSRPHLVAPGLVQYTCPNLPEVPWISNIRLASGESCGVPKLLQPCLPLHSLLAMPAQAVLEADVRAEWSSVVSDPLSPHLPPCSQGTLLCGTTRQKREWGRVTTVVPGFPTGHSSTAF